MSSVQMVGDRSGAVQLRRVSLTTSPDIFGEWDTQTQRRRGRARIPPAAEGRSDMQAFTLGRGAGRNGARSGVGRMGSGQPKDTSRSLGLAGGGRDDSNAVHSEPNKAYSGVRLTGGVIMRDKCRLGGAAVSWKVTKLKTWRRAV